VTIEMAADVPSKLVGCEAGVRGTGIVPRILNLPYFVSTWHWNRYDFQR
jgi:hypothetical protein